MARRLLHVVPLVSIVLLAACALAGGGAGGRVHQLGLQPHDLAIVLAIYMLAERGEVFAAVRALRCLPEASTVG